MKDGRPLTVRVVFRARIAAAITERMWHPRQKTRLLKNSRLMLEFPVAEVSDVAPWVLSWGGYVVRAEPKALRDAVAEAARDLARLR